MSPTMHFYGQSCALMLTALLWWGYFSWDTSVFIHELLLGLGILATIAMLVLQFVIKAACEKCGAALIRNKLYRESGGFFKRHEHAFEYRCPQCQNRTLIGWFDDSGDSSDSGD